MKRLLFFCFIFLVSSAFECPTKAWFRFKNKCYLVDTRRNYFFPEYFSFCKSLNATTVSINSEEEGKFIETTLKGGASYWLGIRQINFSAETYAWLDKSLYNYSNWHHRDGRKNCYGAFLYNRRWYDKAECCVKHYVFCQIDFTNVIRLNKIKAKQEKALKEKNSRLDKSLNTTSNMNSTFEGKLNDKKENINQSMTVHWIFGVLELLALCLLIYAVYKFEKRVERQTNETQIPTNLSTIVGGNIP